MNSIINAKDLEKQKSEVYGERDKILAVLFQIFHKYSYYVERWEHPKSDLDWDENWQNIIVAYIPICNKKGYLEVKQISWHIHDLELPLFAWLPLEENIYDGHTTEEKHQYLGQVDLDYSLELYFEELELKYSKKV